MSNQGKRMVKENLIAKIGQGGGTEYTAGTGINITEDVISVDTTAIQEKLTAGDNITISEGVISATDTTYTAGTGIDITSSTISVDSTVATTSNSAVVKVAPNPVTVGPSANDAATITAWMKTLPIIVGRSDDTLLENAGFTNIVHVEVGDTIEVQGYFAFATELNSSPFTVQHINVCTAENRTGTNTLVNRNCTNKLQFTRTGNQDYTSDCNRYRGTNTSLSAMVDPINTQNYPVYSFGASAGKVAVVSLRTDRNVVNEQYYSIKTKSPDGTEFVPAAIPEAPTTDGTYELEATVASGVVTYAWVLKQ